MLVFDGAILGDYLDGTASARRFLEWYDREPWAVPAVVLSEAYAENVRGPAGGSPETIEAAVSTSLEVLPVTQRTASEAASLEEDLRAKGMSPPHRDLLVAACAREHGGTLATARTDLWNLGSACSVAEYDPSG